MVKKILATLENYLFVLPALLLFAVFSVYPFFKIFQLSVFEWDAISPMMKFVGVAQFKHVIFHNVHWWQSVWHATYITILALTVQNALALGLALAVDRGIRGGDVYRVIFYLPPVLSGIAVGLIWDWIFNGSYGMFNHWLTNLHLGHLTRAWLAEPNTALTCVAVIHMWKGFGWGFVILLAGLQSIPRVLYEAADVDGASGWHKFIHVTVPLMIPVLVLVMILTILGTMQIYDLIVSTTRGGPGYHTEVPVTRILFHMTKESKFGYACAQGIIFGIILLFVSLTQIKLSKKMRQA
ncbi:MAG: sugar ABC transporter permease [Candidatus Omnitrophota bacterium]